MAILTPPIGTTCPALINENYDYHLSGDARKFCKCAMNNLPCVGSVVIDPEDRSSQFFSRGKCAIDDVAIRKCPAYGMSKQSFIEILKEKTEIELQNKIKQMGG